MDKLKDKLNTLRTEADQALLRAETGEAEVKVLEQKLIAKDSELLSIKNKTILLENDLGRTNLRISSITSPLKENETTEGLLQRIESLEDQIEQASTALKQTTADLRATEILCEQNGRRATQLEQERAACVAKFAEHEENYLSVKSELDKTLKALEEL